MEYTRLGNSGLKVSKVILGCMSYGSSKWQGWVLDEEKALPILKHAYDVGLNTWDTADTYSDGLSEKLINKAIKTYGMDRRRLVIMSKCSFRVVEEADGPQGVPTATDAGDKVWINRIGLSRKHILDAVDASVERLGTYIDVLQIHMLDREVPREEIMRALNDVVESGKVRYIGASNMKAWELQTLQNIADKHNWHKFISYQGYYNLLNREPEREMHPYCHDAGIGLTPWSPIARGQLARPWDAAKTLRDETDPYAGLMGNRGNADRAVTERVEEVARRKGVSMVVVATAWCLMQPGVTPIVGINSVERLDEAVEAVVRTGKGLLSREDCEYLQAAYRAKPELVISGVPL